MKNFNLTLLQFDIQSEPEITQSQVSKLLNKATLNASTQMIVLPEMWLGGPKQKSERIPWVKIYDEATRKLCHWAKQNKKHILASQFINKDKKFYNAAIWINNLGQIKSTYLKMHLFTYGGEAKLFDKPNLNTSLFQVDGLKWAQIICYDLRFPELCRYLAMKGAQVIVVHAQWPTSRKNHWITLAKARAIENQIYIVAVNRLGEKGTDHFSGDSLIVDPWGKVLMHMNANKKIASASLQKETIRSVRSKYPFFKERRISQINWL